MKTKKFICLSAFFLLISMGSFSQKTPLALKKTPGSETFDLVYQRCEWTVDPDDSNLTGIITYYYKATQNNTKELVFSLSQNMTVDAVQQRSSPVTFNHFDALLKINIAELNENAIDSISIFYHGSPLVTGLGSYVHTKHDGAPITWTLSCPYGAQDWFPCKNTLRDKADSMDIFITVPKGNRAAANGKLISVTPAPNNQDVFHWKHRYPIATYLVCFAVTNYAAYSDWYVRTENDSLEILNYVYPEKLSAAQSSTPNIIPAFEFYEELLGRYPFSDEKYGHAQFGWGGGMEHQTMSFMVKFDYDLMAHELSHQWCGNMITCGSWSDVWLNEGFATYLTALTFERFYPNLWKNWKRDTRQSVISGNGGSVYCYDTINPNRIFNTRLTYNKGGFVLHTLRWVLGDDDFFKGLRAYFNDPKLQYNFAFTEDFKAHMEAASGKDLTDFFDEWIYGEGYPKYVVKSLRSKNYQTIIEIEQTPSHNSVDCFKLPLPIQFIGESKDTTIIFYNDQLHQIFECNPSFEVKKIVFDPELWTLGCAVIDLVDIKEMNDNASLITVNSNPASDFFTVQYHSQENAQWNLINMYGQTVLSGKIVSQNEFFIPAFDLQQGIYFLKLQTNSRSFTAKLIVAR